MTNISRAFPVYSIAFAIIYVIAVNYNLAPFTYHSRLGVFEWLPQPQKLGPAMYWYAWLVTATVGAAVVAAVSLAIPNLVNRMWSGLVWLIPISMLVLQIYIVRDYFLK
jgi:hypothetical protein